MKLPMILRRAPLVVLLSLLGFLAAHAQTGPTVAVTPPMGWNSWNYFAARIDDKGVRDTADLLVSSGMRDAGYVYVNIDDTWEGTRDASGVIQSNKKFPDMKALSAYVHAKGLKLGIYSSPGPKTCAGFEGSYQHEEQDARTYADWGIDYLKYDLCSFNKLMLSEAPNDQAKQNAMMRDAYERMHKALVKTGRPIVYSLCQYGWDRVWEWGPQVGANLWRTTQDVKPTFESITVIGLQQAGLGKFAEPGHWNDPDMLEVGNGKLTRDENIFHMTLWAMLAAPLLAGNDLHQMTPEVLSVLTNREVIAIDQDALGRQAERVAAEGPIEIWARPLNDGSIAVAIFNTSGSMLSMPPGLWNLDKLGFKGSVSAHDVWGARDLGKIGATFAAQLPKHGALLLRLTR
jgi:alpha-galactosidase